MKYWSLRREVLEIARKMNESGINQGTSGNVSVRTDDGCLITPTGMPYESLKPEDLVEMRLDGRVPHGQRAPSSEWRFHVDLLLARDDLDAIVHAHPPYATSLSCLRRGIPPFHYMVAVAGGRDVRCAPYATFGTLELSAHAVEAMRDRKACLLSNHGLLAAGKDLNDAFKVAREVETLARQYLQCLPVAEPAHLSDREMEVVLEKFRTYGQQPRRGFAS